MRTLLFVWFFGLLVLNGVADRPNILVLISDDQNMDSIGAYGARYATPNIDRLAKEGVLHTRAYIRHLPCVFLHVIVV